MYVLDMVVNAFLSDMEILDLDLKSINMP